jgi:hypothetical protein
MRYKEFASKPARPQLFTIEPDQVKHGRLRKQISVGIAMQNASPLPTDDDLAIAFTRYSKMQRAANEQFKKMRLARAAASANELPK